MKPLTKKLLEIAESIYKSAVDYEEDNMIDWEAVEMWGYQLQNAFFHYKNETTDAPTLDLYESFLKTSRGITEDNLKRLKLEEEQETQEEIKTPTQASKETTAEALADIINTLKGLLGE